MHTFMLIGNINEQIACNIFLCYNDLVCSSANVLQGITTLHTHLTCVAWLSSPMATFTNMHSKGIAHNTRKIDTCHFCCTILEAQCNQKHGITLSFCVQFLTNLQGFHTKYDDSCNFIFYFYFFACMHTLNATYDIFTLHLVHMTRTHI